MVTSGTEAINQVAQEIDGLKRSHVQGELAPFLEGHFLETMVATEGIGATLGLMRSVGGAIGKVGDLEAKTELAKNAAGNLTDVMLDDSFIPESFGETRALIVEARLFAQDIGDPAAKAHKLADLAEGIVHLTSNYSSEEEILELGTLAFSSLDSAAESAEMIEDDPAPQSTALRRVAEVSAALVSSLSESDIDDQLKHHFEQPVQIYEKAHKAGGSIEDNDKQHHYQSDIIQSVVMSAARVEAANPELSEQLVDLSMDMVAEELVGYEAGGEEAEILPTHKALNLIQLGAKLSTVISKEYGSPEQQSSPTRRRLISRMVDIFEATREYRQVAADSTDEDNHFHDYINFSATVTEEAAGRLLEPDLDDFDFDTAKELLGIGFDLAVIHDSVDKVNRDEVDAALETIRGYANKESNVSLAFELFSLAFQKQLGQVLPEPDGDWHYTDDEKWTRMVNDERLMYTAFQALWYLSNAKDQGVALEEIDRDFVEFSLRLAVLDADEPVYPRNSIDHIQKLGQFVGDPELKEHINGRFEALRTKQIEAKRPTERIAQIAYDNWSLD